MKTYSWQSDKNTETRKALAWILWAVIALALVMILTSCGPDPQPVTATATETASPAPVQVEQVIPAQSQPAPVIEEGLPPMTGEQCAQAGAERGWSATWGPATDGCWIISPDGSQTIHLGTWKADA